MSKKAIIDLIESKFEGLKVRSCESRMPGIIEIICEENDEDETFIDENEIKEFLNNRNFGIQHFVNVVYS